MTVFAAWCFRARPWLVAWGPPPDQGWESKAKRCPVFSNGLVIRVVLAADLDLIAMAIL
jgi:hypothetical protein